MLKKKRKVNIMQNDSIHKGVVKPLSLVLRLAVWISTVLVSLAVGFSMTEGGALNQSIPFVSNLFQGLIVAIAGWVVVVLTIVSIILAIVQKF
jgi:hypothetical protein